MNVKKILFVVITLTLKLLVQIHLLVTLLAVLFLTSYNGKIGHFHATFVFPNCNSPQLRVVPLLYYSSPQCYTLHQVRTCLYHEGPHIQCQQIQFKVICKVLPFNCNTTPTTRGGCYKSTVCMDPTTELRRDSTRGTFVTISGTVLSPKYYCQYEKLSFT